MTNADESKSGEKRLSDDIEVLEAEVVEKTTRREKVMQSVRTCARRKIRKTHLPPQGNIRVAAGKTAP